MLDTAKLFWRRMLDVLAPQIREGIPLVGAEPSCVAAFRDERLGRRTRAAPGAGLPRRRPHRPGRPGR